MTARYAFPAAALLVSVVFGGPALAQCPDLAAANYTSSASYNSEDLWTEKRHLIRAGGAVNLLDCPDVGGVGSIGTHPDYKLSLTSNSSGRMLRIKATSACDTVLVVNVPSGSWHYNDDGEGSDPIIRIQNASTGTYDIWVGTYGSNYCDATLHLETFP